MSQAAEQIYILILSADTSLTKQVQMAFALTPGAGKQKVYRVITASDMAALNEQIDKSTYHSVLVDESFVTSKTAAASLQEIRKAIEIKSPSQKEIAVVFVTAQLDSKKVQEYLQAGWTDIVLKPLDAPLFVQKMHFYNKKILALVENALATIPYMKDIEVKLTYKSLSLSEFGMKILASSALPLYFNLSVKLEFLNEPIQGIVKGVEKTSSDSFQMDLVFVGLTNAQTQTLRQSLAKHYSEKKS